MSEEEKKPTITVNDKEYLIDDLTDQQKKMIEHMIDIGRKISQTQFQLDQLQVASTAFNNMLSQQLEVEEAEKETH